MIDVESVPGQTVFRMNFPVAPEFEQAEEERTMSDKPPIILVQRMISRSACRSASLGASGI
ncbi:MAG: hypothetical protein CM15mP46_2780 [Alphaproteobacteria bacterium]|nr:MAG: hypothetical protein CM15mP46_2780 [Alphaproteobacteria bacterium]